jgi:hypothetical protein
MVEPEDLLPLDSTAYEKLVAGINSEEDDVMIEHQYDYELETGGEKEVDVMIWDRRGDEEKKVIVECKFHNHNLNQGYVDEMVGLLSQSDADQAVLITKTGFQSGAIDRAEGLQGTDMEVDIFELRFYDEENDFENTINEINTRVGVFDWEIDVTSLDATPMAEEGEDQQFNVNLNEQDSPRIYTEDGQPTDETLFDRWSADFHQRVDEEEEMEFDSTYQVSFDDVYIQSPFGLFRIDEMEYRVQRDWHIAHEFTVGLESIFEQYDMVLINALSQEREYIAAEDALQSFLSDP